VDTRGYRERLRQLSRGRLPLGMIVAAVMVTGLFAMSRPDEAADTPAPAARALHAPAAPGAAPAPVPLAGDPVWPDAPQAAPSPDGQVVPVPGADYVPVLATRSFEPMPKPAAVRGIYLNAWAAGSARKLDRLIALADASELNAFVIDVKEGGEISYPSSVPLARQVGANRRYIPDVQGMLARLREHGIYPIARIVLFRDPVLAKAKPEWAIQRGDGSTWEDRDGHLWVDSYNRDVWDYHIALAREAIELGFAEIQWDYVRFPDVPQALMRTAVWPARAGRSKEDAVREFLLYAREQLADLGVPVTADVFGLTVSVRNDMGIGQLWEKMADATDVLLPMVYPSHFARGSYGIPHPNASPYATVRKAMEFAVGRSRRIEGGATIRPWLQDFTLGAPRYGAEEVRAQIQAVYDAGLTEWVLWNPGSNYTAAALAAADGTPPAVVIRKGVEADPNAADPDPAVRILGRPAPGP
jgi:hypothetical protein